MPVPASASIRASVDTDGLHAKARGQAPGEEAQAQAKSNVDDPRPCGELVCCASCTLLKRTAT